MASYVRCTNCRKKIHFTTAPPPALCRDCGLMDVAPCRPPHDGTCAQCGKPYEVKARENASRYCSPRCRLANWNAERRNPEIRIACVHCGDGVTTGDTKRRYCSTECRVAHRPKNPKHPCPDCGAPCTGKRCRPCNGTSKRVRAEDDSHLTRDRRESAAPGLSYQRRARLLAKWKRQGRACAYCDQPATTIDHVVPLVRGGTNHEGNLAPACRSCNSRKGGRMVVEWRSGRRLSRMTIVPDWRPAPRKPSKPRQKQARPWRTCSVCGTQCLNLTCSKECGVERAARQSRDAYRIKVGLPVDPSKPTRPLGRAWIRRAIAA